MRPPLRLVHGKFCLVDGPRLLSSLTTQSSSEHLRIACGPTTYWHCRNAGSYCASDGAVPGFVEVLGFRSHRLVARRDFEETFSLQTATTDQVRVFESRAHRTNFGKEARFRS